jgi:hypothetical protein
LNIYPTHKCFDDALDYLDFIAKTEGRDSLERHTLVHGIVVSSKNGIRYAHAWLEDGDGNIIQGGILKGEKIYYAMSPTEFAEFLRVEEYTRYTPRQAVAENHRTGHYGPWVEKYRLQCRNRTGQARAPGLP